jgi:hypothetical protein
LKNAGVTRSELSSATVSPPERYPSAAPSAVDGGVGSFVIAALGAGSDERPQYERE